MEEEVSHWLAVYTKPRWEKKVAQALTERNITVYCPLNKVTRQWSDRKKAVWEPLFKSYVFVEIIEAEKKVVRAVDGVVNFVYWNGKPAVVRRHEIETIKRFLNEFSEIEVEPVVLELNSPVAVKNGLLVNYQGIVIELLGSRAKVLIESMGLKLSATIDRKNLQLL